jgi:hypothetical protein
MLRQGPEKAASVGKCAAAWQGLERRIADFRHSMICELRRYCDEEVPLPEVSPYAGKRGFDRA